MYIQKNKQQYFEKNYCDESTHIVLLLLLCGVLNLQTSLQQCIKINFSFFLRGYGLRTITEAATTRIIQQ
jgi:hypothetical protein